MKIVNVAIAAMVSIFYISVLWITTQYPFDLVVGEVNSTMGPLAPGGGGAAISSLANSFGTGLLIFPILAIIGIVLWWFMKMQEREVVTEAYYY
jgi:lipoprotein signal peptidase